MAAQTDISKNDLRVMTAPLAILKIKGEVVGKMKNIRIQEQYQRGSIRGIGSLLEEERPILAVACSFNADAYVISTKKLGTADNPFVLRGVKSTEQFVNTILMQDNGIDIYIMKKMAATVKNGIVTEAGEEEFIVIKDCFMESQSFDLSEGQIAGTSVSGTYLTPVLAV